MSKLTAALICICFLAISPLALSEIPKEVQRDKYVLALSKALKSEDYSKALSYINKLDALNIRLPISMDYFRGEAYFHTGDQKKAITALNKYVSQAGSKGRYYKQALEILVTAEDKQEKFEAGRQKREYDDITNMIDRGYFLVEEDGDRVNISINSSKNLCEIHYTIDMSGYGKPKKRLDLYQDRVREMRTNSKRIGGEGGTVYQILKDKGRLTLGNSSTYFQVWFVSQDDRYMAHELQKKIRRYSQKYCKPTW